MSETFDRIEEHRDLTSGLEYEEHADTWNYILRGLDDEDPYDVIDPKHPMYYERFSAVWDEREGK